MFYFQHQSADICTSDHQLESELSRPSMEVMHYISCSNTIILIYFPMTYRVKWVVYGIALIPNTCLHEDMFHAWPYRSVSEALDQQTWLFVLIVSLSCWCINFFSDYSVNLLPWFKKKLVVICNKVFIEIKKNM